MKNRPDTVVLPVLLELRSIQALCAEAGIRVLDLPAPATALLTAAIEGRRADPAQLARAVETTEKLIRTLTWDWLAARSQHRQDRHAATRKPIRQLKLQKTFVRARHGTRREVEAAGDLLDNPPPQHLTPAERTIWREACAVAPGQLWKSADRFVLEAFTAAVAAHHSC